MKAQKLGRKKEIGAIGALLWFLMMALLMLGCLAMPMHAQTSNTVNVYQFRNSAADGTVGTMTTLAQNACNPNPNLNCVVIFDPLLNVFPVGNMPGKCANCTWVDYRTPGAFTLTPTNIVSPNINNVLAVDGVTNTTCQAAVTAAGVNNRMIEVPPNYAGPDCPATTSSANNIIFTNFDSTREYKGNAINYFDVTGGGTRSFQHMMGMWNTIPASGANVVGYVTATLRNATVGTGITVDAIAPEANTEGTLSGTLPTLQAGEHSCTIGSTGGTVSHCYAVLGYYNSLAGSTTAVTDVRGIYGLGCNSVLGSVPSTCYGVYGEQQTAGSSRNYALAGKGFSLLVYSSSQGASGIDAEDHLAATHRFIYNDSSDNTNFQCIAAAGCFFRDNNANLVFGFDGTGLKMTSMAWTRVAPTIAAAGCGGAAASIPANNGTAAFSINVGTTPTTTCTVTMPSATNGWNCDAFDRTNPTTGGGYFVKETSDATTSIVLTFFNSTGTATAPTASDVVRVKCAAF